MNEQNTQNQKNKPKPDEPAKAEDKEQKLLTSHIDSDPRHQVISPRFEENELKHRETRDSRKTKKPEPSQERTSERVSEPV